jgi:hypothetical protein
MDDLPRALDEALLKELECPVCMQYMVPPIKLCTNGHTTCSKCRERVKLCPTCRAELAEIRSLALINVCVHMYICKCLCLYIWVYVLCIVCTLAFEF